MRNILDGSGGVPLNDSDYIYRKKVANKRTLEVWLTFGNKLDRLETG
jgi:hypothetical protein